MVKRITAVLMVLCMAVLCMAGCGSQPASVDDTQAPSAATQTPDTASQTPETQEEAAAPKYVFYMIGDGLGAAQRQLTEYYVQHQTGDAGRKLLINTFPVAGMNTTHSLDTLVTDSAAAATALATGYKTNNGLIAVDTEGAALPTVVEEAMAEKEMATGLVSTTRITHATPACFASHNLDRDDENGIAADFVDSGVDFFAGGGLRHFIPAEFTAEDKDAAGKGISSKREDDRNLFEEFEAEGYTTFMGSQGAADFMNYQASAGTRSSRPSPPAISPMNWTGSTMPRSSCPAWPR